MHDFLSLQPEDQQPSPRLLLSQISTMASLAITLQKGYMLLLLLTFSTWISAISINVCSSFNTAETPLSEFGTSRFNHVATHLTLSQMSAYIKQMAPAEHSVPKRITPFLSRNKIHAGAPTTTLTRPHKLTLRNAMILARRGLQRTAAALDYTVISC